MMQKKRHITTYIILSFFLFLFWMAFSGSLSLINLALGVVCSFAVAVIAVRIFGRDGYTEITPGVLIRAPGYAAYIIWEIIKANIDVAGIILNPHLPIDPRVFNYRTRLTGDISRAVFIASINLTPGTVVLDIRGDLFIIHALAARHEEGVANGQMETAIARLFGQKKLTRPEGVAAS